MVDKLSIREPTNRTITRRKDSVPSRERESGWGDFDLIRLIIIYIKHLILNRPSS